MAEEVIKPQSPIKSGSVGIFPLTTFDQIIMPNGARWNGIVVEDGVLDPANIPTIDFDGATTDVYEKTSVPLRVGNIYAYLPTTADQVILSDGTRLEQNGKLPYRYEKVEFNINLAVGGWTGETAPYVQVIQVEGVSSSDDLKADVDMSNVNVDTFSDLNSSWACVGRLVAGDGIVTAYCYEDFPITDVPVRLSGFREV